MTSPTGVPKHRTSRDLGHAACNHRAPSDPFDAAPDRHLYRTENADVEKAEGSAFSLVRRRRSARTDRGGRGPGSTEGKARRNRCQRAARGDGGELPVQLRHHVADRALAEGPQPRAEQRRPYGVRGPGQGDPPGCRVEAGGRCPWRTTSRSTSGAPSTTRRSGSRRVARLPDPDANEKVLFVTSMQIATATAAIDRARQDGYRIVSRPRDAGTQAPEGGRHQGRTHRGPLDVPGRLERELPLHLRRT